ncbi:hypothetical protein DFP74_3451 [Nocardiopsis sp. Huas11]|uniref:hypothetical protein n=1 Tax=Nocardiopsis sp. Huas11 TaxID=2183912 RepID=UPI000EACA7BE|nr:hypothetical protein [Nocardiopsis sp. Huas11]RKS07767.1 hypothetical protein DFP74_3451 [Nocardiopsis sp. Huas11]
MPTTSPPEPEGLTEALTWFLGGSRHGRADARADTTAHVEHVSRFLVGEPGRFEPNGGPTPAVDWWRFAGRIAALAWHAALPTTPERRREDLRHFLARWSATVFADRGARLDLGVLRSATAPRPCVRGASRRLPLRTSPPHGDRAVGFAFVELRSGDPLPLEDGLVEQARERVVATWGTAEQLTAFVTALARRGAIAWDPGAVTALAERTGLARSSAALLLAGHWPEYRGVPDAAARAALGLSSAEAALGSHELRWVGGEEALELYRAVLPEDPEAVAALWEPGGAVGVAERLAEAWNSRYGRRVALPEGTVAAFGSARLNRTGLEHLRLVADPGAEDALCRDASSWIEMEEYAGRPVARLRHSVEAAAELPVTLGALAQLIAWAHAELPTGDPVRQGIPAALRAVRERLTAPGLLLSAADVWRGARARRLMESLGDRPCLGRDGVPVPSSADNGTVVAVEDDSGVARVWLRPAALGGEGGSAVPRACLDGPGGGTQGWDLPHVVGLLRSPGFTAIAAHVAAGGRTEGSWDCDPGASVPDLVDEVVDALGVSWDAARLYLQVLTLLEPTDRRVRAVNGWTAARLRGARSDLVAAGLVVAAERRRAGRSVFLPGGWTDARSPNLPLETWKLPLYGLRDDRAKPCAGPLARFLALRPLPELFTEAWRRVREGDGPGR